MNTNTKTAGPTIRPYVIPTSVDATDAGDFLAMVDVRNRIYREISGADDEFMTASELLPNFWADEYTKRHFLIVELDGVVVGRVGVDLPLEGDSHVAFWSIELIEDVWGQGIGTAAYDVVEQIACDAGRTSLQSWAEHPASDAPRLEPPTGFGYVPKDHIARFYLRHGYSLEQVERKSLFDLQGDLSAVDRIGREARVAASAYEVVQWMLPTPAEFVAGYCLMKERMVTDAPSADMEFDEESWDEARLRKMESRILDGERTQLVTAARHRVTGELCAFNELNIPLDHTLTTHQNDTLVLSDHRGHRLGALVKSAGILRLREIAPDSPRIITWNAEENRPMLSINEELGFYPAAHIGAWKKVVA
ncbi:GNAT family N-acetyltransferase [Microbacterium sp. YY-03]|uniref:GNAT family N-acetyltransferase n=1 Tax=Microbacterium sp. YY-03 TaxID=3421636 RepID=UPI003D1741A3